MNIRNRHQRISHPWGVLIQLLMPLLLGLAICTGCGQKTAQQRPAQATPTTETPPAPAPYAGITETGEPPPDEYYGDPLFWIPSMEYETFYIAPDEPYSEPILFTTAEGTRRLDARYGELLSVQG